MILCPEFQGEIGAISVFLLYCGHYFFNAACILCQLSGGSAYEVFVNLHVVSYVCVADDERLLCKHYSWALSSSSPVLCAIGKPIGRKPPILWFICCSRSIYSSHSDDSLSMRVLSYIFFRRIPISSGTK